MGVKDLFKYLIEASVFDDTSMIDDLSGVTLVDFNSFFFAGMFCVKSEADLPLFPHNIANRLRRITDNKTIFFIDKGNIEAKTDERAKRKNREMRDIDLKILESKEFYEDEILALLGCHPDVVQCYPNSNHQYLAKMLIDRNNTSVVHANMFDAEYAMVKIASYMGNDITLVSNDQDTMALAIINLPHAKIIYQGAYYQLIQDEGIIKYAQLITFVTVLCNKSDYFNGLEQITAKTFLNSHYIPYEFNIAAQAQSDEITDENDHLMTDIVNAIKKPDSRRQYLECNNFSKLFCDYVKNVSRFLTLDTSFFL